MWLESVHDLRPGQVLGHAVLDGAGRVLLNAGVTITERYLAILRQKNYRAVFVRDPKAPVDAPPDEDIPFSARVPVVENLRKAFGALEQYIGRPRYASIQDMIALCRSESMRPLLDSAGPIAATASAAHMLVRALRGRATLSATPLCIPDEEMPFHRYVNAAIAAALVAERAGLHDTQVVRITHGTMLHDVGALFLRHQIESHTYSRDVAVLGYEMLKHCGEGALLVAHCALEQFEHVDGSGRPRGIRGSNTIERQHRGEQQGFLTLNGEICAVAKAYDRLIGGDIGQPALPAWETRQRLRDARGTRYNQAVVDTLLRMLPPFPCGAEIVVTEGKHTGWSGVVDELNHKAIERPIIVLYRDESGAMVRPVEVDLTRHADVQIAGREGERELLPNAGLQHGQSA